MKFLLAPVVIFAIATNILSAQCPEQTPATLSTLPNNCNQAIVLTSYILNCQDVCFSSIGSTTSTGVSDLSCFGGSNANDVWLTAPNPYNTVPGYDGSLVFRWIDWPNRANGVPHPNISIHAEIAGTAGGLLSISIDCTSPAPTQSNNFAQENAFCIQNTTTAGDQFYGIAGTIPRVQDIPPPSGVTINNIQYYLQLVPADGARGDYCFDVSTYQSGFLCGDALPLTLTGSGGTQTGSASGCLCATALNGTIYSNPSNNLPVPCGVESPSSAWYALTLPYSCNKVTVEMSAWGGTGNYNIALLSGVNCPGSTSINPYTGATINTPGQTMQPGAVVEGSSCGQTLNLCRTLAAGTYYVYISGESERPTFSINVTVQEVTAEVGSVTSPLNNGQACSGSDIELTSSGAATPLSGTCGQDILWYISTNLNFNPYNNQGTLLGAGTGNLAFSLPVNNTCSPVNYYVKGIISDNGVTPQSGCRQTSNTITVAVYPVIGQVTLLNQPCIISAAPRCPSFIVNGQTGTAQIIGNFAMDGEPVTFTVSNGLQECEITVTDTMRCIGNCDQPLATALVICDMSDIYNFYVDVDFTPGSAFSYIIVSSDGLELLVFDAGIYRMGPFTNGVNASISVTNTEDVNCNIPLGNFTSDCNPLSCPNLTSLSAVLSGGGSEACEGAEVILTATVDDGVINADYRIQWHVNGNAIPGANTLTYSHITDVADNCSAELQTFSATITCIRQNASPPQTPQLTATGSINIFPVPVLGTDFLPSTFNCTAAPVDLCNALDIIFSPSSNPPPGTDTVITYTIRVADAPSGCEATGSYAIQCPPSGCGSSAGVGATNSGNAVCSGEQFSLSATGVTLEHGYSLGFAWTTTNPYSDLEQAVQNAIINNQYLGPYTDTDNPTFTNNGSTFPYGTYYFIPFTALNIPANQTIHTQSGTYSVSAPFGGGSATVTVPSNVAYCQGETSYNASLSVQQQNNTALLNAIDAVTGPIVSYSGGATSTVNLSNPNFTGDPNGATTTISGSGNLFLGANINYSFSLSTNATPFPTRCPSCPDVGNPVVLKLLPPIILTPPALLPQICFGESVELTEYNPASNIAGAIIWHDGNPAAGGNALQNTNVIPASNGSTYWALFRADDDSSCTVSISITITPDAAPTVNALPPPAPFCAGTEVDLTVWNNDVTTDVGTLVWYRGNPSTNPLAVRLQDATAAAQQPANGSEYCAKFTDAVTGCFAYSCVTFNVNPLPPLTAPAVDPIACEGLPFDLNTLEPGLTSSSGTFVWFEGDPAQGGVQLTPQQETGIQLTPGNTRYCAIFTDDASACENKICLELSITPLPVLNALAPQGPICSKEPINLVSLQPQITTDNGTWQWTDENGNDVTDPSETYAEDNAIFYVLFTSSLTGCSDTTSVHFTVNPSPTLNALPPLSTCIGISVDLTDYESDMLTSPGTFIWYKGDSVNFGVALTPAQAQQQLPSGNDVYRAVFENSFSCSDTQSVQFSVNPIPVLNSLQQQRACFGISQDLTALNDSATSTPGTFTWYPGINTAGTPLTDVEAQSQIITGIVSYTVNFTDTNGCSAARTVVYSELPELTGASAAYSCALNSLTVNLSGASGGAGGGYVVSSSSPNQNGETLLNGSSWTVIVEDSLGCTQTFSGSVNCVSCEVGDAAVASDTACCNTIVRLEASGIVTSPNYAIAWGLSPLADGPISNSNDVSAAADAGWVWQANADGSLDFVNQCPNIPAGNYYFTPFIIEDPVITPFIYDTLNGCTPDGQICPTVSDDPDWIIDTLMGVFPNGDTVDLIRQLTEALLGVPGGLDIDITKDVLNSFFQGVLPCFQLTSLYAGDPNGSWSFIINNTGTVPLTFAVPDFEIIVYADSCAALGGADQSVIVPGSSLTIPPNGQFYTINFLIPPLPASFPAVNSVCEAYGNAAQLYITDDNNLCTTGISERHKAFASLSLVPNPAMNWITINAALMKEEHISVSATDILGKEILLYTSTGKEKQFTQTFDISDFTPGIYLFRIRAGYDVKNVRVVKL